MEHTIDSPTPAVGASNYQQAWELVVSQLRMDMSQGYFESWVIPLIPLGYSNHIFRLGAKNPYGKDWVESRLKDRVTRILEGVLNDQVTVQVEVINDLYHTKPEKTGDLPVVGIEYTPQKQKYDPTPSATPPEPTSNRKIMLQRAYGSKRAAIIQPERGMLMTMYFFAQWLPQLGHSAFTVIMAARSMCYWNPKTGELRNTVETDMAELADRASVSVRTVKDVLKNELVRDYFLRYRARRIMTPNGVRTAGITLQVRMDDPLTPQDQEEHQLWEEEHWFSDEFNDYEED